MVQRLGWAVICLALVVGCGGGNNGTGGSGGTAGVGGSGGTAGNGGSGGMIDAPAPDAPMPDASPDSSPPDAGTATPTFTGSNPPTPSNVSTTPSLLGTADAGALVRIYTTSGCSGSVVAMGDADGSGHFSIGVTVTANSSTTFFATADVGGLLSTCSGGFTYVHDDVVPSTPVLTGTNPTSPSRSSTSPQVQGTAEAATTVRIFKSSDCSGSVASLGSSTGSFAIGVAVTPNASTSLSATATDAAGNVSGCSNSLVYVHDNIAPSTPLLTATSPSSPSNSSTMPDLLGMTEPLSGIAIYVNPTCTGAPVATGTADGSGSFSIAVVAGSNTSTTWYATASDSIGNVSGCSMGFTYVHDDVAPATPMFTGLSPSSPSNSSTTPTLLGNAEAGSLVRLYAGTGCSGSVVASGTATTGGSFAIQVTVTQNSSTTFHASATDAASNVSNCSSGITFTNDINAPSAPVLSGTSPPSPSNSNTTPQIQGTAEAFATLRLYTGTGCSGTAISTTTVPSTGSFSVGVTVGSNTSTTFFADATDAAGNRSGCSNGVGYTHDDMAPPAPTLTGTNPASPSNTSTTPQILGVAEAGATVRLYATNNCTGTLRGSGTAAANGSFAIGITVNANTSTTIFAAATDAAGNTGMCSNGITYTHDTIPPNTPSITASMPPSPSRISTTPLLTGTADPSMAIFLYTNSGCSGAFVAMGASTTGGSFSIGVSVLPDTQTTFFAQAVDAAGNPSGCSGGFTYVHDDQPPAAPAITGSNPTSPSRVSTAPQLTGTAEAGSTVRIYVGSCASASVASGTANGGTFSIGVTVSPNSSTTFFADATDAAGNRGNCSSPGFTYVHDSTPPNPPVLTGISPTSPSDSNNPTVSGTAEVGSTISLFRTNNCSGGVAATTTTSSGGSFSIGQAVSDNTSTSFSAIATDAAGNPSTCSNSLSYQEVSPVISGTVTYTGGCTGRIFISLTPSNGDSQRSAGGTSLAAPGPYQIRGVFERGALNVRAWCDALGVGAENVGIDPTANVFVPNYTGGPLTVNLTLVDPTPQTPPQISVNVAVPLDSGIVGSWKQATNSNGDEIADHYRFYVATSGTPGPGNNILSKTVKAAALQLAVMRPLTNGTTYQVGVAAINNGIEGPVSPPIAVTVGVPAGGATASGTVNFSGFTPSGDLYAIAYDSSQGGFAARVASPAASQPYSITGLPTALNDTYYNFAILDANGDGQLDATEPTSIVNNGGTTGFTIVGGTATAPTVTITSASGNFSIRTAHALFSSSSEIFRTQFGVSANRKLPVTAVVTSGPNISPPIDLGMDPRPNFGPPELGTYFDIPTAPVVGASYSVDVTFLDGSTATLNASVTAVLPLPTPIAPIGTGSTTPTFQWNAAAGGPYLYSLNLSPNGCCGDLWHVEPLSSGTTSALFNFDGTSSSVLVAGTMYQWSLNANDALGNTANVGAQFQAQ